MRWDDVHSDIKAKAGKDLNEVKKRMRRILKSSGKTFDELPDDILGSAFRTAAIWVLVEDASAVFISNYDAIMNGTYTRELLVDGQRKQLIETLKRIGRLRIYRTPSNLKLELMGRKIILDLMDIFWEGARSLPMNDGEIKPKIFQVKFNCCFLKTTEAFFTNR